MLVWQQRLGPGSFFLDIGANAGVYTVFAGDLGASVLAAGPEPDALRRLRRNLELNRFEVEVVEAALSSEPGEIRFSSRGTVSHIGAGDTVVRAITLDDVLGDRTADGVKIDVEGAERLVLLGGSRALADRRLRCIQLEWNGCAEENFGETREPLAALLADHGYGLYRPDERGDLVDSGPSPAVGADVFALPPEG